MVPQFLQNVTAAAYHRDPLPTPSLSSSIATTLIRDSPLHAWLKHPRFGDVHEPPTAEQERGTIIHSLLLGGDGDFVPVPFDNYRTKAAQEQRDAARADGKVPLLAREVDELAAVASAVELELAARDIVLDGDSEAVVAWEEEVAGGRVLCRGMIDHLAWDESSATVPGLKVYDLKSCYCAHPRVIRKHIVEFGYDIQRAAYLRALEQIHPELAGRIAFQWLFFEVLPPGSPRRVALTVAEPDGSLRELGERRWTRACEVWNQCLRSNQWPAYTADTVLIDAPPWALTEEM